MSDLRVSARPSERRTRGRNGHSQLAVTVFTFVHGGVPHVGTVPLNAVECGGIYPPNREK